MKNFGQPIVESLIVLAFSVILKPGFAQKGVPFITNYTLPVSMSVQNYRIVQGDNGVMYVLNQNGAFCFDGYSWDPMPVGGQPMAMAYLNNLFVGGDGAIGYFKKNLKGVNVYVPIEPGGGNELFYLFHHSNNTLYAAGVNGVYRIRRVEPFGIEPYYTEEDSTQLVTDMFSVNTQLFLVKNRSAIFSIHRQEATRINTSALGKGEIAFSFRHNGEQIIGTSSNRIFRFDGNRFTPILIKDQRYADENYLTGGISMDARTIALSTLMGGCVVVDVGTGETSQIINYSTGLPDDEITAMEKDSKGGLWLIHGMGISRVDLSVPIASFHHIPGLRGNILSTAKLDGSLFVGASDGLYKLNKVQSYTEKNVEYTKQKPIVAPAQPVGQKKKGLFSRIFGKRQAEELTPAPNPVRPQVKPVSTNFVYQKVAGVSGKINFLQVWNSTLLAASSTGLYSAAPDKPTAIIPNEYIFCINPSVFDSNTLYVGSWGALYRVTSQGGRLTPGVLLTLNNEKVTSISEVSVSEIVFTTDHRLYRLTNIASGNPTLVSVSEGEHTVLSPIVRRVNTDYLAVTPTGIFRYYHAADSVGLHSGYRQKGNFRVFYSSPQQTWLRAGQVWNSFPKTEQNSRIAKYIGLLDRVNYISYADSNEVWVVNGFNQLYRISATRQNDTLSTVSLFVKQVLDKAGNSLNTSYVKLKANNNAFKITLSAPFFLKENGIEYQYRMPGLMPEWTDWGNVPEKDFPFFPPGNHTLQIRARDAMGNISSITEFPFGIKPPFYRTAWFYLLAIAMLIAFVAIFVRMREQSLMREKLVLEEKVRERTKTIEEQKNSIEKQRDELREMNQEILRQKEEIESQHGQIVLQNQDIIRSISYARRIQTAVMPGKEVTDAILKDYFILLKPRNIVSGDFFWVAQKGSKIVAAAADCTGHGVPGAFMSLLGITMLSEIAKSTEDIHPHTLLNELRSNIKRALSQAGKEYESRDGMDVSLSIIDTNSSTLLFAGAYNPLYLVRDAQLVEYKGDNMPVGAHIGEEDPFTLQEIQIRKNDCIYMFSDGYVDQFGGERNRKFMAKNFKELLVRISDRAMPEQKQILDDTIDQWMGPNSQIDDILVMGIRL